MLAVQALCVLDALGDDFLPQLHEFLADTTVLHELGLGPRLDDELFRFVRMLVYGVRDVRKRADELLAKASTDWRIERMTLVDRNVLRLGVYELMEQPDTPVAVVMSEAIETVRCLGDVDSAAFVNGVLDAVRRELGIDAARG